MLLPRRWHRLGAVVAIAAFAYCIVIAGLAWQDASPAVLLLNAALAVVVVSYYVARAPASADALDHWLLLALVIFAGVAAFSQFPRQAFDSVLAAMLYVAAVFTFRSVLAVENARRLFVHGLMALSALLTVAVGSQVVSQYLQWWALTNWTVIPPLDLRLRPEPWTFGYEMTLLLVLLYPSWWIGKVSLPRRIAGIVVGFVVLVVCIVTGSRTVWLAALAGGATVTLLGMRTGGARFKHWRSALAVAALLLVVSLVVAPRFWKSVGERLSRSAPIAERLSIWEPALGEAVSHPLVGTGPGSFPWILQGTGYYDMHSYAPRQPDSVPVQVAVEVGLLGSIAAAIVVASCLSAVRRGRSRAALFAAVAWLVASLAMDTAESTPLIAIAIGWISYAAPRSPPPTSSVMAGPRTWHLLARLTALSVIGLAFLATIFAALSYQNARAAIRQGDMSSARSGLSLAAAADPSLGLYSRQLGTLLLLDGSSDAAVQRLKKSVEITPTDALAWRTLGLADMVAGQQEAAHAAFARAVQLQRSDPTNLMLLAQSFRAEGDETAADQLLAVTIQGWPTIVAAPGWSAFAAPTSTAALLTQAYERWRAGLPSPEPLTYQNLLLAVMNGETALAASTHDQNPLQKAYVAVMNCGTNADAALAAVPNPERRTATYWELRVRQAELTGQAVWQFVVLRWIMTNNPDLVTSQVQDSRLNPLHENLSRSASPDTWGYRRSPIDWPATEWDLPSPTAGFTLWHLRPTAAVLSAGLQRKLPGCSPSSATP